MKIKGIIILVALFVTALIIAKPLNAIYIDYLWFDSLTYGNVFKTIIFAKIAISSVIFAIVFALIYGNLLIAKNSPQQAQRLVPDDIFAFEGKDILHARLHKFAPLIALVLAFLFAREFSHLWYNILAFLNKSQFNQTDPIFAKDISYYVFSLPVLKFTANWLKGLTILTLMITASSYILSGNIEFGRVEKLWVTEKAKKHILFIAAFIFLFQGITFLLEKHIILLAYSKNFAGVNYTLDHVNILFLNVLFALAIITAIACIVIAFKKNKNFWAVPVGAIALMFVLYTFGIKIVSVAVDKFIVEPNELRLETPYIANAIDNTRKAMGLDKIQEKSFTAEGILTLRDLDNNRATIDNIRLWDNKPLLATYGQLQEMRTYYSLMDVDNDRYIIDGKYRQVMISVRELNYQKLPSSIWINERIIYTHGFGAVASNVNEFTPQGLPEFIVKDIPPRGIKELKLDRPNVYFGELSANYAITNTKLKALDYPSGDKNVYANYKGKGGISVKNTLRKAMFALYFNTLKIFLSSDITGESKILMNRNIVKRVRIIAPFLNYDSDPYPVIHEGRIYWIIDAYTHSSNYPYSERIGGTVNYIRNSVKVIINAYDGTTDFYTVDETDPILRTYKKFLPDLFKPLSQMPENLRKHLRYPREMFSIQAMAYLKYHMKDPKVFYNQEDLWDVPSQLYDRSQVIMEPYYNIMKLAGNPKEEYVLMLPFTPSKKDNMIAWLAARSDAPHSGELLLYRFPKEKLVYGPMQIEARINQDSDISEQFTLWGQKGTRVIRGSLMVIPVEKNLLYIEPVYLQAEIGKIPELRKVIVVLGEKIAMENTLNQALETVIKGTKQKSKKRGQEVTFSPKKAQRLFLQAQKYLRQGNWAEYGKTVEELGEVLKRLAD